MNANEINRLKSLASMLEPLSKLAPALERIQSAEQAVRDCEIAAARIAKENADAMEVAARVRDEMAQRRKDIDEYVSEQKQGAADLVAAAREQCDKMISDARASSTEIAKVALGKAQEAERRARTIDQSIADKTAEVQRLEAKVASIRDQLKKMTEI